MEAQNESFKVYKFYALILFAGVMVFCVKMPCKEDLTGYRCFMTRVPLS